MRGQKSARIWLEIGLLNQNTRDLKESNKIKAYFKIIFKNKTPKYPKKIKNTKFLNFKIISNSFHFLYKFFIENNAFIP